MMQTLSSVWSRSTPINPMDSLTVSHSMLYRLSILYCMVIAFDNLYWTNMRCCVMLWWTVYDQCLCVYAMADIGIYWTMCGRLRTKLAFDCGHEIHEIWWLARNTSVGAWCHTLWMPAVPNDAASASWLLSEDDVCQHWWSPVVQVLSLIIYWVTGSVMTQCITAVKTAFWCSQTNQNRCQILTNCATLC